MSEELEVKDEKVETKEPEVPVLTEAEQRASSFGWLPKEKWLESGKSEDEWVPAAHFNKFGELKRQVIEKDKELSKQSKLFLKMKEHHLKVKEDAYQAAYTKLKSERMAALKENDLVRAEEVKDAIEELRDEFDSSTELPAEVVQELNEPVGLAPEFLEFVERNPWYRQTSKDEISMEADALGAAIKGRNPSISNTELLAQVEKKVRQLYPEKFGTPRNPQHDSGHRTSSASGEGSHGLTKEQLEVAAAFELDPKEYAKQLKAIGDGPTKRVSKVG